MRTYSVSQSLRLPRVLLSLGFLACITLLMVGCKEENKVVTLESLSGDTMGTYYNIHIATTKTDVDFAMLESTVKSILKRVNVLMSTYDPFSELSKFNSSQSTEWVELAPATINLIKTARSISEATDGAYDITLGSVIDLWGFGRQYAKPIEPPSMDTVFDAMNRVGHQLLQISKDGTQVRKLVPQLTVDLSSIAKGYAVDRLGLLLESQGLTRYLVEIGGEIRTRGVGVDNNPWQIGIESPDKNTQAMGFVGLAVQSAHLATSGDYRNYREVNGERLSHIIDGRSGFPITHNLVSVTVLHGSTVLADAWATAYMVMGAEEAMKHARGAGLAVSMTTKENDTFVRVATPAFDAYRGNQ